MTNARCKDVKWVATLRADGAPNTHEAALIQMLMDLRDELKRNNELTERLVATLECRNAQDIPRILRRIDKRLASAIDTSVNKP